VKLNNTDLQLLSIEMILMSTEISQCKLIITVQHTTKSNLMLNVAMRKVTSSNHKVRKLPDHSFSWLKHLQVSVP